MQRWGSRWVWDTDSITASAVVPAWAAFRRRVRPPPSSPHLRPALRLVPAPYVSPHACPVRVASCLPRPVPRASPIRVGLPSRRRQAACGLSAAATTAGWAWETRRPASHPRRVAPQPDARHSVTSTPYASDAALVAQPAIEFRITHVAKPAIELRITHVA